MRNVKRLKTEADKRIALAEEAGSVELIKSRDKLFRSPGNKGIFSKSKLIEPNGSGSDYYEGKNEVNRAFESSPIDKGKYWDAL